MTAHNTSALGAVQCRNHGGMQMIIKVIVHFDLLWPRTVRAPG